MTFSPNPRGRVSKRTLLQFQWESDTGTHSSLIRLGHDSYSFSCLPTELYRKPWLTLYYALHLQQHTDIAYLDCCLLGYMRCSTGRSAFNCLASAEPVSPFTAYLTNSWVLHTRDYQLVGKGVIICNKLRQNGLPRCTMLCHKGLWVMISNFQSSSESSGAKMECHLPRGWSGRAGGENVSKALTWPYQPRSFRRASIC